METVTHRLETNMTKYPVVITKEMKISTAAGLMKELCIRHLPVTENAKIIGVVTERDLLRFENNHENKSASSVEEVMIKDSYITDPSTSLPEIVSRMAKDKLECTVIVDSSYSVVGIFTTTDALNLLTQILEEEKEEIERDKHLIFIDQWAEWDSSIMAG